MNFKRELPATPEEQPAVAPGESSPHGAPALNTVPSEKIIELSLVSASLNPVGIDNTTSAVPSKTGIDVKSHLSNDPLSHTATTEKIIDIALSGAGEFTINGANAISTSQSEFDFKSQGNLSEEFPLSYLRQYYGLERPVTDDEIAVYEFIQDVVARHLVGTESCLEIGCGPTVHHAIMLAPFVAQMSLSDYLESNLIYVNAWKDRTERAWDWTRYTSFCIERDGNIATPENIALREEITRKNLVATLPINILNENPLGSSHRKFDVVSAFYCTEEVALNVPRWQQVMRAVTSLIDKNGYLLMSCLYNSDFYHIAGEHGEVLELPCAKIDEAVLRSTLESLDFEIREDSIRLVRTPEQEAEGVPGVLLVFAQKRIDHNAIS